MTAPAAPSALQREAVRRAIGIARERAGSRPPVLGVAGAQGSGKSTLADRLVREAGGRCAQFSLDDVYLTRDARLALGAAVHPLLATRGPPGTHDLPLLDQTLNALIKADVATRTLLPRFDKLADERAPASRWPEFDGRPELIVVDGWCIGALPQPSTELTSPINDVEREEDKDGVWRAWVHQRLTESYVPLWSRFDAILALEAPSFDVVAGWRMQQEEGLLGRALQAGEEARIRRFIQVFERITRSMLAGSRRADVAVLLDARRTPIAMAPA